VIEISSYSDEEEDFFADIARGAEFAKRLFGELNRDLLGLPGDGKVNVISDSDEEEEARVETITDVEATPSTVAGKSSTPASSAADADEDSGKMQVDSSDDIAPGQDTCKSSGGTDEAGVP
jgi:hypothetical protein